MREQDEQAWHDYERDLRAERKSPRTIEGYQHTLSMLSDALPPGTGLLDATRGQLADWLADVSARHASSTHATWMRRARTFYTHMIAAGYCDGPHPMQSIARVQEEVRLIDLPDPADIVRVLDACQKGKHWRDRRDYAMMRVLLEPGTPRATELATLPLDAPDLRHDELTFMGKGGLERCIPLGAKSCKAMSLWLRVRPTLRLADDPRTRHLLWFSQYGPLDKDGLYKIVASRCRLAGVKTINPHAWRHFSADAWFAAGGTERDAMRLFGWRSDAMAKRYGASAAGKRAREHAREMSLGDRL